MQDPKDFKELANSLNIPENKEDLNASEETKKNSSVSDIEKESTPETKTTSTPKTKFEINIPPELLEEDVLPERERKQHAKKKSLFSVSPQDSKKTKINKWIKASVIVVVLLGLAVFCSIYILQSANDLFGLNKPESDVEVVIPEEASISEVADILFDNGIIQKKGTFVLYASMKNLSDTMIPGTYEMNTNYSYDEIIIALRTGNNNMNVVDITFVEGSTLNDIAALLEENGVCSAEEFLETTDNYEFDYDFIKQLPNDELIFHRLEGYIFPDTYQFFLNEEPETVVQRFLDTFVKRMDENDIWTKVENSGYSFDEIITLASVIEKEASKPDDSENDMEKVSSVFHNRLNDPTNFPKLQSDVTLLYAEYQIKPYLTEPNQDMLDAYNTRKCDGLPIAPICNPGIKAILAALEPADTNYYFFVTDKNGKFYYATTLAEHEQNIAIAEAVN